MMKLVSEKMLIVGLRNGNYDSYNLLFKEYYANYVAFVRHLIHDENAAEDIVQEAFTKIYINRARLDETKSLNNYIFIIIKRLTLNYIRDLKNSVALDGEDDVSAMVHIPELTAEHIDSQQMNRIISAAMASMPPQRREVFTLSRIRNFTNKEIADSLGLSVRTVERHISLALSDIRRAIAPVLSKQ